MIWEDLSVDLGGSSPGSGDTNSKKNVIYDTFLSLKICIYQKFFVPLQRIFKTLIVMTDKTISAYQGYGHRVQLIRRSAVARSWSILDNRKVVSSVNHETLAKDIFLNHVAGIVRQMSINFQ